MSCRWLLKAVTLFHPEKRRFRRHRRVVQMFTELAWKRELDCTQRKERDPHGKRKGGLSSLSVQTFRTLWNGRRCREKRVFLLVGAFWQKPDCECEGCCGPIQLQLKSELGIAPFAFLKPGIRLRLWVCKRNPHSLGFTVTPTLWRKKLRLGEIE